MAGEELVDQFVSATNAPRHLAEQYLARNDNNLIDSIEDYFSSQSTGISEGSARSSTPRRPAGGIRTFRDLNQDEGEEDDKTNTNFFTGGEKSGLQVEDPNKKGRGRGGADSADQERSLIDQIFQRAKEQMDQPDDRPSAQVDDDDEEVDAKPKFSGSGFKLGDGTEPSTEIKPEGEQGPGSRRVPTKVTREIIFWKQGFTVADGPLHRYDDPENAAVMQELNRGRVPMALLDVEFGQDVDVSVYKKTDEDWTPPKRKIGGFHGQGQRLGSPVPGEGSLVSTPKEEEAPAAAAAAAPEATKKPSEGDGDSLVQIRFANGKRTSHKFNSDDPLSVVYEFVKSHPDAPTESSSRKFILSHAFPKKPIENSSDITVAEAKLKNAVIVQFWDTA